MAKKKAKAPDTPKVSPLATGPAAQLRARRDADYAWDKAQQEAQRAYDMLTHGAWQRYITALKAHGKAKSAGTDFDRQYDREREMALKGWQDASRTADKKLQTALDAIGGDQLIDEET
jgi:hypothetical protein